jgi:hypothetical protein
MQSDAEVGAGNHAAQNGTVPQERGPSSPAVRRGWGSVEPRSQKIALRRPPRQDLVKWGNIARAKRKTRREPRAFRRLAKRSLSFGS